MNEKKYNSYRDYFRDFFKSKTDEECVVFGEALLSDFRRWFLFWFKVIYEKEFIVQEQYHGDLFETYNKILHCDDDYIYTVINLCPRSSKTELIRFSMIYSILCNAMQETNNLYITGNKPILKEMADRLKNIFTNKYLLKCYPLLNLGANEVIDWDAKNEFENDNDIEEKKIWNSNKIKIGKHTIYLFSMGTGITGVGAGVFTVEKPKVIRGAIWIDDPDRARDVVDSPVRMERSFEILQSVILSRRNDKRHTPICIVQQRLGINDMTGHIIDKRDSGFDMFKIIKKPLLNEKGECLLPLMYDEKSLRLHKASESDWMAQFMQEPMQLAQRPIDVSWFKYYDELPDKDKFLEYDITVDTAMSEKTSADESVITLFGITNESKCYIIDILHGHWSFITLKDTLRNFYLQWSGIINIKNVYIEGRNNGISLQQELTRNNDFYIPIKDIQPTTTEKGTDKEISSDKYARALEIQYSLKMGRYYLPSCDYEWKDKLIKQAKYFTGQRGRHDDFCDSSIFYPLKVLQNNYGFYNEEQTDYDEIYEEYFMRQELNNFD